MSLLKYIKGIITLLAVNSAHKCLYLVIKLCIIKRAYRNKSINPQIISLDIDSF